MARGHETSQIQFSCNSDVPMFPRATFFFLVLHVHMESDMNHLKMDMSYDLSFGSEANMCICL